MFGISGVTIIIGLVILCIIGICLSGYVKASPDKAYIISGLKNKPRVLTGKAGIKIPFLEKKDELNLQLVAIDVKTQSAVPTSDYINIRVDATVNVKIGTDEKKIQSASQNFLNKSTEYISSVAREVLEGNVREIVGKMKLEEMVSDRQKFAELVRENAEPDLANMGLDIISFNVQNFIDENGVIENLGIDNIVKIQKNAAISKAESQKEIKQAEARAAQEANDAEVASQTKIAERNNELAIRQAELKIISDTKKAAADAAYKIQQEQSRKEIEVVTADANIQRQEKEIELRQKNVEVNKQELEATVKNQADANKYAAQQKAEADLFARQKDAEARYFEAQKEAEAIRIKGEAEAEAIRLKATAEADGLKEKAEAMELYGEAAKQDMQLQVLKVYFEQLPQIAAAVANGYNKVDKINIYGGQSSQLQENLISNVTQISEGLSQSMGIDLKSMLAGFLGGKIAQDNHCLDVHTPPQKTNKNQKERQAPTK